MTCVWVSETLGKQKRMLLLGISAAALFANVPVALSAEDMGARSASRTHSLDLKKFNFDIPEGKLSNAIEKWSETTNLTYTSSGPVLRGLYSAGLSGSFTAEEALAALLRKTKLQFGRAGKRTIAIFDPGNSLTAHAQAIALETIDVTSSGARNPNSVIDNLPPPFAGGQVATGGQVGMLGVRSVMDTPFNQISYTQQTIQDQQARQIEDVLMNDPSVRVNTPRATGFDSVYIRGFNVSSSAYGINGLYGLASIYSLSSLDSVERVEVLKGPGTLLNGMPPSGGVGGSINLVTKRAGDEPLAQITNSWTSKSQFGTHVDLGRRFGEAKEWGIRINGSYRNGSTEISEQKQEVGSAALGLDYRGERVRFSADFGYQDNAIDVMSRMTVLGALTAVPAAPSASANYMPEWGYWNSRIRYGLVQGEVDLTENVTAYAQAGILEGAAKYLYSDIRLTNVNGNFTGTPRLNSQSRDSTAYQTGLRAQFDTGIFHHAININVAGSDSQTDIVNTTGLNYPSNIYNPRPSPVPQITVGDPIRRSAVNPFSYGIADTVSMWDKRVQITVGVRRQTADTTSYSVAGAETAAYNASAWSPAYAIVVKPWDNVSIYANYIEGLESGTVVGTTYANAGEVLAPYKTQQYETGIKVDWGKLITTVSAFEITKPLELEDVATNTLTQNGEVRNRGIEVNVFGEVAENIRVLGGVMFLDARQVRSENPLYDGKRAYGLPDTQVNLGAEWDTPFIPGLTLTGRAIHTASVYTNAANTLTIPDWTRYDVGARYKFLAPWNNKPVVVRFSVENVFDKNYWQGAVNENYISLGAPRTYLLSTTFNF